MNYMSYESTGCEWVGKEMKWTAYWRDRVDARQWSLRDALRHDGGEI